MKPTRVLVIGLDGATFDLINPWVKSGHLPNLSRLMASGIKIPLQSTLQPTTAPAWVTFMTGVNQGQHGLYDFIRRKPGEYAIEITNSSHVAAPTLFEIASQAGRRVTAVNVPYTYPPRPINGIMVSGPFAPAVTPDIVYPSSFFKVLKEVAPDYFILPDFNPQSTDPFKDYALRLMEEIELRERLSLYLLKTQAWDLFTVVFMATDEAQHAFWHCQDVPADSPLAPYRWIIRDIYQRVDRAIGTLLEIVAKDRTDRETIIVIMSDHGAGPLRWMINLNRWLAEASYLHFQTSLSGYWRKWRTEAVKGIARAYRRFIPVEMRRSLRTQLGAKSFDRIKEAVESYLLTSVIDWKKTQAYALGAGGNIFINLQGREPGGIVPPGKGYQDLCLKISDALRNLKDPETGHHLVEKVHQREALYQGGLLHQAPDLIIQWADYSCWGRGRFDSQGAPVFQSQNNFEFSNQPLSGTHRLQGILIVSGPGLRSGVTMEKAHLLDLAPTILNLLEVPIPETMEGSVLTIMGESDEEKIIGASRDNLPDLPVGEPHAYSPEEEAEITGRLESLGYF